MTAEDSKASQMNQDVFISYATPDKALADALCQHLEEHGLRCWIAPRDVLPGSVWGAAIGLAIICGPIVGGVVTSFWGWRWTFLINIPICLALIVVIVRWIPDSRDPSAEHYDIGGCITFAAGLFLLTWSLIDAHYIALRLGGAALMLALFVDIERRHRYPMLDLALFGRPAFLGAVAAMMGYSAAAQVLIFFLPMYLQNAFGFSPLHCGVAMLPFAIPLFVVPRISARASARHGSRAVLTWVLAALALGVLVAVGDLLLAWTAPFLRYPLFAVAMVVTGSGAGVLNGETALALQSTIPPERSSTCISYMRSRMSSPMSSFTFARDAGSAGRPGFFAMISTPG